MSLIRFIVAYQDVGAYFFLSWIYRSAVSNGLTGKGIRLVVIDIPLTDAYSLVRKLYLLKRASVDVHNLCVVVNLNEMENQVQGDDVPNNHVLLHCGGKINLAGLIPNPDPRNIRLMIEWIVDPANNLVGVVEEIALLHSIPLPLLDKDPILGDPRHLINLILIVLVRENVVRDLVVMDRRSKDPADKLAHTVVETKNAKDRHFWLT